MNSRNRFLCLFFFVGLTFAPLVPFAESPSYELRRLFEERYFDHYRARQCGQNAKGFILSARSIHRHNDLSLIEMHNAGVSWFGLVNAEYARGRAFGQDRAVEQNWHYHAFVIDRLGMVYDFDFGIRPQVLSITGYIEKMWLDEIECDGRPLNSAHPCIGRQRKLRDYKISVYLGEDIARGLEKVTVTMTLGEFLDDWR